MKVTIDIPNEYYDKYKENAVVAWNDYNQDDKNYINKGLRFELDIDIDGVEIDTNDVNIYGGEEHKDLKELPWVNVTWTPDADDLKGLVELTVKKLNRFKSALESISAIK